MSWHYLLRVCLPWIFYIFYSFLIPTRGMARSEWPCKGPLRTAGSSWTFLRLPTSTSCIVVLLFHISQNPKTNLVISNPHTNHMCQLYKESSPKKRKDTVTTDVKQLQYITTRPWPQSRADLSIALMSWYRENMDCNIHVRKTLFCILYTDWQYVHWVGLYWAMMHKLIWDILYMIWKNDI